MNSLRAQRIVDKILLKNLSKREWLEIFNELHSATCELTKTERQYIAESGAGEMLYHICSSILLTDPDLAESVLDPSTKRFLS